jgi:hypothetical protein
MKDHVVHESGIMKNPLLCFLFLLHSFWRWQWHCRVITWNFISEKFLFLFYFRIKESKKNMIFFVAKQKVSNMSGKVGLRKLNGTKIFRSFFRLSLSYTLWLQHKKMWKLKKSFNFTWAFGTSSHQSSQPENYSTFVFLNDLKCAKRKRNGKS